MMEKLKRKQQELQSSMAIVRSGLSNAEALADQTVQKLAAQFAGVPSDQLTAKIAQKFAKLDLDQDGQLNREEFRAAFTGMTGRRLGEQELDSLMSMFDADGNEMIDQVQCGKLTDNFNVCMSNLRSFKADSMLHPEVLTKLTCMHSDGVRASCTSVYKNAMRVLVYHLRGRERRHSH